MKRIVSTKNAPAAIGPYSQAVIAGDYMFISGQIPLNPETGKVESKTIQDQSKQVIKNLSAICEENNRDLSDIVKLTIYLIDLENFSEVNSVMEDFFQKPYPARATIEVSKLPLDVQIEIEAIVYAK
jgi:2-iminobutanoate/2-iminopropanoate deaminase